MWSQQGGLRVALTAIGQRSQEYGLCTFGKLEVKCLKLEENHQQFCLNQLFWILKI
jgi:hypothetical protein